MFKKENRMITCDVLSPPLPLLAKALLNIKNYILFVKKNCG